MAFALQCVPERDVPSSALRSDTCLHSLPQPGQELSAKGAARLGYSSECVQTLGIYNRKKGLTPDASGAGEFITEADHREVREDFQKGLIWKLKDCS